MAVTTKQKPAPAVETKDEPEVVVDLTLNKKVEEWTKSTEKADRTWMLLAAYVRDKEISAATLTKALIEVKGLKESSARVETSRLMRFTRSEEASDMLDSALEGDGDITVRDLRSAKVLSGEKAEKDPQEKLDKKLVAVARYAISEAEVEDQADFVSQAKRAWKSAYNLELKAQAKATASNGDDEDIEADPDE